MWELNIVTKHSKIMVANNAQTSVAREEGGIKVRNVEKELVCVVF